VNKKLTGHLAAAGLNHYIIYGMMRTLERYRYGQQGGRAFGRSVLTTNNQQLTTTVWCTIIVMNFNNLHTLRSGGVNSIGRDTTGQMFGGVNSIGRSGEQSVSRSVRRVVL